MRLAFSHPTVVLLASTVLAVSASAAFDRAEPAPGPIGAGAKVRVVSEPFGPVWTVRWTMEHDCLIDDGREEQVIPIALVERVGR